MAYENPIMTELMVPRSEEVKDRIIGFYSVIGWGVRDSSNLEFFTYVHPEVSIGTPPTVAYWQTVNKDKINQFTFTLHATEESGPLQSMYSRGLRLPQPQELVEVCLVVPSDDDVHSIFNRGGDLLFRHTHILPQDHEGAQEFRFVDPFNYSLRVTADPGWEINQANDEAVIAISKSDFLAVAAGYNLVGVGQSWHQLLKFVTKHQSDEGFPLSIDNRSGRQRLSIMGDLDAAIEWIQKYSPESLEHAYFRRMVRVQADRKAGQPKK